MINALLVDRIHAVSNSCEGVANDEMNILCQQVRIEQSRLRFPAFQAIGQVWLQLIVRKESEMMAEISKLLDAAPMIDQSTIQTIDVEVTRVFGDMRIDQLHRYADSLERSAQRSGLVFRREDHRLDLADTLFRVGLSSLLDKARNNITVGVQVLLLKKEKRMDFSSLMKDRITVFKKNGDVINGVKAAVSSDSVTADAAGVLIEPGDLLRRNMSNGAEETFEVIDPGFHEAFHTIPAGYQMKVRKLGLPEAAQAVQSITYNLTGPNARVNQNSIDNSTNTVAMNPDAIALIEALRAEVVRLNLGETQQTSAMEVVDAVDHHVRSAKPSKIVVTALLSALPHAASIATIVSALASLV